MLKPTEKLKRKDLIYYKLWEVRCDDCDFKHSRENYPYAFKIYYSHKCASGHNARIIRVERENE